MQRSFDNAQPMIDIPSAPVPQIRSTGQAIDGRSLLALIGIMAFFGLVVAWSWGQQRGMAAGAVLVLWAGGMVLFIALLIFVQSETLLQALALFFWSFVEVYRVRAIRKTQEHRHRTDREIAEIHERLRLVAQADLYAQVEEHSQPQSHSNLLANFVPPDPAPFRDELRERLLVYLVGLYEGGMADDGRIEGAVPWSKRGSMDREKVLEMFRQAGILAGSWVVRQEDNKHWYVNRARFSTPGLIVRVLQQALTPGGQHGR